MTLSVNYKIISAIILLLNLKGNRRSKSFMFQNGSDGQGGGKKYSNKETCQEKVQDGQMFIEAFCPLALLTVDGREIWTNELPNSPDLVRWIRQAQG